MLDFIVCSELNSKLQDTLEQIEVRIQYVGFYIVTDLTYHSDDLVVFCFSVKNECLNMNFSFATV